MAETELDLLRGPGFTVAELRVVETLWAGQPACIAALRDVTERKRAEQNAHQLIRAEAARSVAEECRAQVPFPGGIDGSAVIIARLLEDIG